LPKTTPLPNSYQAMPSVGGTAARAGVATHVVKRMLPSQPGAQKLAQRYGDALVCVRYRHDPKGKLRYTTVELIVDASPVAFRAPPDKIVMVHIDFGNASLQRRSHALGARWDSRRCVWRMPLHLARRLRLVGKIVRA